MARKWGSPKQLKALKKLIAARRAMVRGKGGKASKARRSTSRRRQNPLHALIANPALQGEYMPPGTALARIGTPYSRHYPAPGAKIRKTRKRRKVTTKKRAKPRKKVYYLKAAPRRRKVTRRKTAKRRTTKRRKVGVVTMARKRRRVRRRAGSRRITRAIRVPKRYARKYMKQRGKRRFYINPRRRRNGSGGSGGLLKSSLVSLGAGFASAGVAAVIDKYAAGRPMIARVAKLVAALAIAKFGSRYPRAASAAIGGLAASEGYNMATKMLGGLQSAQSEGDKIKSIADAASGSPGVSALLSGGMGALLNGVPDVASSAYDYNIALSNMAGDADDDE